MNCREVVGKAQYGRQALLAIKNDGHFGELVCVGRGCLAHFAQAGAPTQRCHYFAQAIPLRSLLSGKNAVAFFSSTFGRNS